MKSRVSQRDGDDTSSHMMIEVSGALPLLLSLVKGVSDSCGNVDVQTHGQSCRFRIKGESETLKSCKAKSNRLCRIDSL